MWAPITACREPAGSYNRLSYVVYVTGYYLILWWSLTIMPYGATRPKWVNWVWSLLALALIKIFKIRCDDPPIVFLIFFLCGALKWNVSWINFLAHSEQVKGYTLDNSKQTSQVCITHWGRVTHICVGKPTTIGSDNGLSPGRRQVIIWTNAGILLIRPLGTNFNEVLIEILTFSFMKMRLKVSSAKWRPFVSASMW